MARRKEISNSLGGNEIGSCNNCGQRESVCCLLVLNLVSSTLTKIGDILPWEDVEREAEKLLEGTRANVRDQENSGDSQEQDDDRI